MGAYIYVGVCSIFCVDANTRGQGRACRVGLSFDAEIRGKMGDGWVSIFLAMSANV